jgi:hypothetical protein
MIRQKICEKTSHKLEKELLTPAQFMLLYNEIYETESHRNLFVKLFISLGIMKQNIIVDRDNKIEAAIDKSLKRVKGGYDLEPTKSPAGYLTLVLPTFAQVLIESPDEFDWLFQREKNLPPYASKMYNDPLKKLRFASDHKSQLET